jgi:predicted O-methyltransferase YrrM
MLTRLKRRLRRLVYEEARRAIEEALFDDSFNLERQLQRAAMEQSARYVTEHVELHKVRPDRIALLDHCLSLVPASGLVLEFGVYAGSTLTHIADRLPDRPVYGFDSFEGLNEPWMYHGAGMFKVQGLPEVPGNVTLVKGLFQDTSAQFLASHPGDIVFIHIDSDLYSSCKYIFDAYGARIVPGSVILFDEYFNYPGWQGGEFKAFHEWCSAEQVTYEFVGFTAKRIPIQANQFASGQQVGVRVRTRGAPTLNCEISLGSGATENGGTLRSAEVLEWRECDGTNSKEHPSGISQDRNA